MTETKICRRCENELPLTKFNRDSKSRGGFSIYCKPCYHDKYMRQREKCKNDDRYSKTLEHLTRISFI